MGMGGEISFRSISVHMAPSGAPKIILYGRAKDLLQNGRVLVSLSHTDACAIAQVVLIQRTVASRRALTQSRSPLKFFPENSESIH
jgi:phosphopantetheinyl transferase (holo-ACP synthase)